MVGYGLIGANKDRGNGSLTNFMTFTLLKAFKIKFNLITQEVGSNS
jgi:hypothetical protein